jgi:electron transfer flavoprotein beta subunit
LNIGVLIKTVPDTESKIKLTPDGTAVETSGIKYVMNPFDEFAVEEALKIREKLGGDSKVTVISLGGDRSVETLRTALAMGADDAVHVSDPAFEGGDAITNAKILAKVLEPYGFDLVLCGKQGIDYDAAQTPAAVAEYLGMAQACVVVGLEVGESGSLTARRRIEGGDEILEVKLPAVITCEKGLNEPRYASLPGIMKAKKKEIKKVGLADTGLDAGEVGENGATTKIVKFNHLPERPPCKMLSGEPQEVAAELVRSLREDAKIV